MTPTPTPTPRPAGSPALLPDPDTLRTAIAAADTKARLLRKLLRAALELDLHLITGDCLPTPADRKGVARVG